MGGTGLEPVTPSLSIRRDRSRLFAQVRERPANRAFREVGFGRYAPKRTSCAAIAAMGSEGEAALGELGDSPRVRLRSQAATSCSTWRSAVQTPRGSSHCHSHPGPCTGSNVTLPWISVADREVVEVRARASARSRCSRTSSHRRRLPKSGRGAVAPTRSSPPEAS
jgi:hypothetical protein